MDDEGGPTEAHVYLEKVLSISSGRRHYFEEVNKLIPNLVEINHNYSYSQPPTAVGKLLGVEFILNRCRNEGVEMGTSERVRIIAPF